MLVQFSEVSMANVLPRKALKPKKTAFDAQLFLDSVGASRRVQEFRTKQAIFSQGEPADSVIYVQKGSVKLTVVNESGKEAVVAIFGSGDFLGEGGMAGQPLRMGTATAMVPTTVLIIGKDEMTRVLHAEHQLADRFITYMLARNIREAIHNPQKAAPKTSTRLKHRPATETSETIIRLVMTNGAVSGK